MKKLIITTYVIVALVAIFLITNYSFQEKTGLTILVPENSDVKLIGVKQWGPSSTALKEMAKKEMAKEAEFDRFLAFKVNRFGYYEEPPVFNLLFSHEDTKEEPSLPSLSDYENFFKKTN